MVTPLLPPSQRRACPPRRVCSQMEEDATHAWAKLSQAGDPPSKRSGHTLTEVNGAGFLFGGESCRPEMRRFAADEGNDEGFELATCTAHFALAAKAGLRPRPWLEQRAIVCLSLSLSLSSPPP